MRPGDISTSVARRIIISVLASFVFAVASTQSSYAQTDPVNGAWGLNIARSTIPAGQAQRGATLTYQGTAANKTATNESVDAQGRPSRVVFTHIYDGQPHPTTGSPDIDASAYTRLNANTIIFTRMKEGKLAGIGSIVVSPDGRTLTVTGNGVGGGGLQGNYVLVYEKK